MTVETDRAEYEQGDRRAAPVSREELLELMDLIAAGKGGKIESLAKEFRRRWRITP